MRRLAVFLDGTWNTLNNNTNVWRLKSLTAETAEQRVYYWWIMSLARLLRRWLLGLHCSPSRWRCSHDVRPHAQRL